jgi:predicted dehydrogenase
VAVIEDPRSAPPLRWGILGPGKIARRFVREALAHTTQLVTAVGSRNLPRAQAFAHEFGIDSAHGDYRALVEDPDVDVVYVATPHSEHRANALLAIEAGKSVLVEKPLTRNAGEAREVFDAATDVGVFVMEAMWSRFLPHTIELTEAIARGVVGDVVGLGADHGQLLDFGPTHRLLNPDLAGGAVLDLGVYPLSFAHLLLGVPERVTAVGRLTETGVDGHASIVLSYGPRTQAVIDTTLWSPTPCTAWVAGDEGRLEVERTFYAPSTFRITRLDGTSWTFDGRVAGGFQYQIAEAARRIAEGEPESPLRTRQDTLEVMALMDEVRAQLGVVYPGE